MKRTSRFAKLSESLPHDRLQQSKGRVIVTGLVITRQRPGTASGVIFLTLEDERGEPCREPAFYQALVYQAHCRLTIFLE